MDSRALLAHIVSQTRQNVEFLMSQKQISPMDGGEILAKLPRAPETPMAALEQRTQNLLISPPLSPGASQNYPQAPPLQPFAKAKALWGYNEEGLSANGLCFRAGEIIEIIAETNADWWSGRCNGRQGLFPSNYVEKLAPATFPPNFGSPPMSVFPSQPQYQAPSGPLPAGYYTGTYQPAYQPPPGAPLMGGYSPYAPPPGGQPTQSVAGPPPVPPKTSKLGQLGNTLAQSAVGGVGFGAGSAIGGDLVNSIF